VSGVFNSSLEMNWKTIEDNGGKIGSSISAKTSYVGG
jgi:NAD-dependent DNA ligase